MHTIKFLDGTEKEFESLVGEDLREAKLGYAKLSKGFDF